MNDSADTLVPQLSDSAKSPPTVIDEIANGELPMLRSKTVWGWLVEAMGSWHIAKNWGLRETDGAAVLNSYSPKELNSG
jgi:hypothetical protein